MKSTPELVVDATTLHRTERVKRHFEGLALTGASVMAKQETQRDRPRKFRCSAEAAVRGVVSRRNLFVCLVKNSGLQIARGWRLFANNLNELLSGAPRGLID